ncbi:MAG TPA: CoA transferase [Nocardioidaceae bacterium]|nr:CoA transferase [Nocardioidaceae bacterium]
MSAASSGAGSLAGVRVLDLSRVLGGPYCTQILADHGADVIKVEPPAGDETRAWGPPFTEAGHSWYFAGVNRNKRSVVVDLSGTAGRDQLLRLLGGADVLVENFRSGTLERWGLGYHDVLAERFPRLVHCSITGFGPDGPLGGLPGYDAVVQAMTGMMSVNGEHGGSPLRVGMPAVDMITGLNAANGILLALNERVTSGRGQYVETTLFDCGLSVMHPHLPNYFGDGRTPVPTGNSHPNITPYSVYRAGDGDVVITAGNDRQFRSLCEYLDLHWVLEDPRFVDNAARGAHRDELRGALQGALASRSRGRVSEDLMARGVPCGPINDVPTAVEHPHTRHRGMVIELGDGYRGVASPVKLSRTPARYRLAPPRQGEHAGASWEESSTADIAVQDH